MDRAGQVEETIQDYEKGEKGGHSAHSQVAIARKNGGKL